ncbi:MAG: hypothetical protein CTY18_06005 [Methylomonas sp.]|nr:MAG: hypothetical protein CTY18_06005 [Methylomonas sp.]
MATYPELYRQLAREILANEARSALSARELVDQLARRLNAKGYALTPEISRELTDYADSLKSSVRDGIEKAAKIAIDLPVTLQSATIANLAEQAFNQRWPDGIMLSDRLFNFGEDIRSGLTDVLQQAVKAGQSTDKTVLVMQRTIERASAGQRFAIVQRYQEDWVKDLYEAGVDLIRDPQTRKNWDRAIADVSERIDGLKVTGSRRAAERVFSQIKLAVEQGREELADSAVKYWLYDKQLYSLKRIARTEMSVAMHQAVIAGTENDDTIIGYQWRLSSTHVVTDICDYYASIDMGLGKGVFTKDTVPRFKAHPQCTCLLIPRVTPIRTSGNRNYAQFLGGLTGRKRRELIPQWAAQAIDRGAPVDKLVRSDGLGLITRDEFDNNI